MPVMASSPSAGGDLGSAAAPGPGIGAPPADVLFTLMSAGATLAADKLKLTGVSDVTLFSSTSRRTGVYTTGVRLSVLCPGTAVTGQASAWGTLLGVLLGECVFLKQQQLGRSLMHSV